MKNILAALMFFTRLPFWRITQVEKEHFKNVVNFWPYAGIVTGGIGAGVMIGCSFFMPAVIAVICGVVARVLVTGALHEDGLADFFDGFGGGTTREATLRIMKDSHIGSYGVIGLIFYFALLVSLLSALPVKAAALLFFCGDILSKSISSGIVNVLPYARTEEESKNRLVYNRMPAISAIITTLLVFGMLFFVYTNILPVKMAFAIIAPVLLFWILIGYMNNKIQGYTGDCCGAVFLLCELSFLFVSICISNLL